MNLLDLPEEVLSLILLHVPPQDYLRVCRTSKQAYSMLRQESTYWRSLTATIFRLPISPLLAADGPRWYWLYRKLSTQTRLYTWGQGLKGNLGQGRGLRAPPRGPIRGIRGHHPPHAPPRVTFQRTSSDWPTEAHVPDEVGVIADLQCGGWSTTILSSDGKLYTAGALDSLNGITIGETAAHFKQLEYLTQSTSAVHQFSSGRRHVLALTDDGEILSWDRINSKGLKVFSKQGRDFGGKPTRIAAGWDKSSAYVPEIGIVYWDPLRNDRADDMLDGIHVEEKVIHDTGLQKINQGLISVTRHVVLVDFILWITSESKLFACRLGTQEAFPIPGYSAESRKLKDVQGQYQKFGVFTEAGEVLAGNTDFLSQCYTAFQNDPSTYNSGGWTQLTALLAGRPVDVPAMQHTGVIGLAYGDHHYHALHADGTITSYGTDSQQCGQLGLGRVQTGARFRGLGLVGGMSRDAVLHPLAERRGRQIWFEPEKKDWLAWLSNSANAYVTGFFQGASVQEDNRTAMFTEWVEQEGRHWKDGPQSSQKAGTSTNPSTGGADYESLNAYFAITIAASGWHSGALVLVDDDKAYEVRSKYIKVNKEEDEQPIPGAFESRTAGEEYDWDGSAFPTVMLPDGDAPTRDPYHSPTGEGAPRLWRDGMPTMEELGL